MLAATAWKACTSACWGTGAALALAPSRLHPASACSWLRIAGTAPASPPAAVWLALSPPQPWPSNTPSSSAGEAPEGLATGQARKASWLTPFQQLFFRPPRDTTATSAE